MLKKTVKRLFFVAVAIMFIFPIKPIDAGKEVPEGMVAIPAGWFQMGAKDGKVQDGPPRRVYLDAYAIDKYEVTNADMKKTLDAHQKAYQEKMDQVKKGLRKRGPRKFRFSPKCDVQEIGKPVPQIWDMEKKTFPSELANHPMVCVSRTIALRYCKINGKRLPTEAEWEKAARGTKGLRFPWGNKWDPKKANTGLAQSPWEDASDGYARTAPVGSFPKDKSPYGVYDMAGNVWEWTADNFWVNYHSKSPKKNPGPFKKMDIPEKDRPMGEQTSIRGGSWALGEKAARASRRTWRPHNQSDDSGGFRCAVDLK